MTRACPALVAAGILLAQTAPGQPITADVVRGHCSVCHSWELVEAQRLDRANWQWVLDDMVNRFGATWIDPRLQELILDYLVEHHGPAK